MVRVVSLVLSLFVTDMAHALHADYVYITLSFLQGFDTESLTLVT